jgi:HSP20 family protein
LIALRKQSLLKAADLALTDTVDTENVSATGRNGVLEISIAKHAKAQPRRITIK